ncbi:MAG: apolipoprotein N-acyltransferase, partial [Arenicellales bacterium]
ASVGTWYSSWAGLSGILSVSLVWAMLAGYGAYKFQSFKLKNMAAFSLMLMLVSAASWGLQQTRWTEQVGAPLEVALVQADIPLSVKWQAKNRENLMQTYLAASRAVIDADLIVWPEGALPMVLDDIPEDYINDLRALDADVAFGAIERKEGRLYNGISLLSEQNDQQYRKQHLVPFGEFFPLKWLLGGLFETLQIPMSDFTGFNEAQSNFSIKGIKILPTICYEDAFPEDWRAQVADSNMILNISEDAWFGDSFAPHQRLQMAQMRAIEFQRPMIRVSNSGLSTVINDDGSVDQLSPQFQPALFSAPVFPMQGQTPYTRYGLWPLWGLSLALLVFAYVRQKRKASS